LVGERLIIAYEAKIYVKDIDLTAKDILIWQKTNNFFINPKC
jgi:hypothetical protein